MAGGAEVLVGRKLRARHLPVETNGHLAGIISIGDVIKHHIRAMEQEADSVADQIR